ncbi:MAG: prolipoprotein diacylglyceryl transferase [Oscillospiraceae bacterium]|nr:prolipoprotein diacylglyceryl transferase [Oscillospiraceae bacterium]
MTYTEISFPSFGLTLNPKSYIEIGPLNIHFYGIIIALGLVCAVLYCLRRKDAFGLTEDDLIDGVLWVTPFAIICARVYYVIFKWQELYADNPISALYIWQGGLAIYGGVIGAVVGIIVYCRFKKLKVATILDTVSLGFLIGQAMGRWGNFFNREAFGAETDSFLRMGLMDQFGNVIYVHPTFLYESLWNICGLVLLHFLSRKRQYDGQIALGYAAWYGLGRAFIEGLRTDSLYWGPFRVSQLLAAVSCLAAVVVLLWNTFRYHDPAQLFVNEVAARKAAAEAEDAEAEEPEAAE